LASSQDLTGGLDNRLPQLRVFKERRLVGWGSFEERPGDGRTSGVLQVDSIVADGRLDVCDGSYIAFVMKTGRGQIAGVRERSQAAGAEYRPSGNEERGPRRAVFSKTVPASARRSLPLWSPRTSTWSLSVLPRTMYS